MNYSNPHRYKVTNFSRSGKKHTLKNIGKKTIVISYTNFTNGLIVKNKQLQPDDVITIHYVIGTFYTASITQIHTIELCDFPEKATSQKNETTDAIDEKVLKVENHDSISETNIITTDLIYNKKLLRSFYIQQGLNQLNWRSSQENIVLNGKFVLLSSKI